MKIEDREIIIGAILAELIINDNYDLTEKEVEHAIKSVDPNILPFEFIFNKKILSHINWNLIDIKKIQIAINRNPDIISFISDETKNQINFKEIKRAFVIEPNKFFDFNFEYGNNLDDEDIYHLIINCNNEFFDVFSEITKKFSTNKKYEIIKLLNFDKKIISFYELNQFDSHHICEIAINVSDDLIYLIPIKNMNINNWIKFLSYKPNFVDEFDKDKLLKSDSFYLVSFVCIFPEYEFLLEEKILKSISIFSWEKLIESFPKKYEQMIKNMNSHNIVNLLIDGFDIESDLIDLNKISTKDWLRLFKYHKKYINYFDLKKFSNSNINDIIDFIRIFPEHSNIFPEKRKKEVTSLGWEKLLISNKDYFFDMCDFYKLTENSWENVIKTHPELKVHKF